MSVKVVQNICDDVKEFDNKEDFIKYYELNQNNLKDVSTCMLNKKFKINGYHIGRKQGELQLIPLNLYDYFSTILKYFDIDPAFVKYPLISF